MPGIDGRETTRRWRAGRGRATPVDVPIVALTAHVGQAERDSCRDAGMTDYLSKPFGIDALADMARTYLDPRQAEADPAGLRRSRISTIGPRVTASVISSTSTRVAHRAVLERRHLHQLDTVEMPTAPSIAAGSRGRGRRCALPVAPGEGDADGGETVRDLVEERLDGLAHEVDVTDLVDQRREPLPVQELVGGSVMGAHSFRRSPQCPRSARRDGSQ